MSRIVFWGAGRHADVLMRELSGSDYMMPDEIIAFCDNDSMKWGKELLGIKVVSPGEIAGLKPDQIIISCVYNHDEIMRQIHSIAGLNQIDVVSWMDYKKMCYASRQFQRMNSENNQVQKKREDGRKHLY